HHATSQTYTLSLHDALPISLSNNVFDSGGGVKTSGYSPFGVQRPGATIKAFDSATGVGICDGAILRAKIYAANPKSTIEPVSWGDRKSTRLNSSHDQISYAV